MSGVRDEQPRHRQGNRAGPRAGSDHRNLRRHDPRARSTSSLLAEQAAGRAVEIVYSPLDALRLAQENPTRQIVFVGVGFETTTPLVAMAIKRARAMGLTNFTVYGAHKNMPGALEVIINDPALKLDALILPGHVSKIGRAHV